MARGFRFLVFLYPASYRAQFGVEMTAVHSEIAAEQRAAGWNAYLGFLCQEYAGLLAGACKQWWLSLIPPAAHTALCRTGASAASTSRYPPEEVLAAQQRVEILVERMVHAIAHHQFEDARRFSREEQDAREALQTLRARYELPAEAL